MFFKGAICLSTLLVLCITFNHTEAQKKNDVVVLSKGIEEFGFSLLLRTALKTPTMNVVISPFSVWAMLTVLSEGANGITKKQLQLALRHPTGQSILRDNFQTFVKAFNVKTNTVELETTNFIFADRQVSILPNYRDLIMSTYLTGITNVDFQNGRRTADEINNRVRTATRGKIPQIVYPGDMDGAQMILINAVFFHGQWTMPFNSSLTTVETFYNDNLQPTGQVRMMYQRGPYPYVNSNSFRAQIVEIPYGKEDRLSMVILIPKNGVKLEEVFLKFTSVPVKEIFESLRTAAEDFADDEVDLYLPRFSVTSGVNMNAVLNEMGIHEPFDPLYADFSNMTEKNNLYLSRVIHKAQIEVTEEGTVASAVTAGELANRNTPPKVVANKPFFYIIVEKNTNVVVFGGTYVAPQLF